ncbi:MAG: toll/interleukin-1 receptor domain-containing protein [Pseudomonadota bacterium]
MKRDKIFLSYRRDDSPGYVSRLEDELERTFGKGRVFRDATDIPGGTQWKNVIDANLHASAALILFIGPRWETIWRERAGDQVNYVELELLRARELGVPIIPLTLDGTTLSPELDLGSVSFLRDSQFHDISDRQGRWRGDFGRLVRLLEQINGIGSARRAAPPAPEKKGGALKALGIVAAVVVALLVTLGLLLDSDQDSNPQPVAVEKREVQPAREPEVRNPEPEPVEHVPVPDISGIWEGADGTTYYVQQYANGSFKVESPGYGSGEGTFIPNMPRKFEIVMYGIGRGEFAVSATGDRAMGWIIVGGQKEYDTLVRVE